MQTKVQKWGNSLAIRIPRTFAHETLLEEDAPVELTVEDGVICITPGRRKITLSNLLDAITDENLHKEVNTGDAVGDEAW